jgi:hypothetical protein
MMSLFRTPPVVIIGMHRSGTSMIASMLESLGLFIGSSQDPNHESTLFHGINGWILRQCGGAWDHPAPVRHLLVSPELRELTVDYIRFQLRCPGVANYLGWGRYLAALAGVGSQAPWGWKDPVSTVTLPLWLDCFPDARVLHIRRHGLDVAKSIAVRQGKLLAAYRDLYPRRKALYWLFPKRGGFTDTVRCGQLSEGLSLWEEYLAAARQGTRGLGDRLLEVSYEDFLSAPQEKLALIASFCGLSPTADRLAAVAGMADGKRGRAYLADAELLQYTTAFKERLSEYGY